MSCTSPGFCARSHARAKLLVFPQDVDGHRCTEGHEGLDVPRRPECLEHTRSGRNRSGQILEPPKARKDTETDDLLNAKESYAILGAIFEVYRDMGR